MSHPRSHLIHEAVQSPCFPDGCVRAVQQLGSFSRVGSYHGEILGRSLGAVKAGKLTKKPK